MGGGTWTPRAVENYAAKKYGVPSLNNFINGTYTTQEVFTQNRIAKELNPYKVMRECRDSEEHPNTIPVILGLDVTGSMGGAAVKTAQVLNEIMTTLYNEVNDVEFCTMGIGDLFYDYAPIQISQFESDVRIIEQLDKIYFEGGGGGNSYESYTAAWYMGLKHCDLDCWKRGKKGIIITMGDELPNPYLPEDNIELFVGDKVQRGLLDTKNLYKLVIEKYDVYHISIDDIDNCYNIYKNSLHLDEEWTKLLGQNYIVSNLNNLAANIIKIVTDRETTTTFIQEEEETIEW